MIRKTGEAQFWFVQSSDLGQVKTLAVPQAVKDKQLPAEGDNVPRTLHEAMDIVTNTKMLLLRSSID